jgi:hypothetical protein
MRRRIPKNKEGAKAWKPRRPYTTDSPLEPELPSELQRASIIGRSHLAEVSVVEAVIYSVKLRVVEGIEGLEAELEFY